MAPNARGGGSAVVVITMGHGSDRKRAGLVDDVREGYFGVIVSGGEKWWSKHPRGAPRCAS